LKRAFSTPAVIFGVTVLGAAWLFACTAKSGSDEPTSTPAAPTPQTGNGDAVGTPQGGSKCEELGALSATALTGMLDTSLSPQSETTSFTLPNRPTATKVKVVAVGAPSELVGKGAVLGASVNVSYATCTHCLVIAIGCTATSCDGAALFFPRAGTGTFTALAAAAGQPFSGTFTDVELEQVNVDPQTFASTPVVNGACMHVSSLTFGSTLSSPNGDFDAGGTSTSSSGDIDDGGIWPSDGRDGGKSSTSSGGAVISFKTL